MIWASRFAAQKKLLLCRSFFCGLASGYPLHHLRACAFGAGSPKGCPYALRWFRYYPSRAGRKLDRYNIFIVSCKLNLVYWKQNLVYWKQNLVYWKSNLVY